MTSLLNSVEPEEAEGQVKTVYDEMMQAFGMIPNAMKLQAISPELLESNFRYIGYFMQNSGRTEQFHTFVRLLVSDQGDCDYCVNMNTSMLLGAGMSMEEVNAIKKDPAKTPLEADELALLLYVLKAAHTPKTTTAEDVKQLRGLGFSDKDIFEAVHYGAHMVMADILFETFKLENDQM